MKKFISLLSAFMIATAFVGCSSNDKPEDMPEAYYKAGVKFINILDQVLDVEMDFETAYEETEYYVDVMKGYGDYEDIEDEEEQMKVLLLSSTASSAFLIRFNLNPNGLAGYAEDGLEELLEDRNRFAKYFNIEEREE